jgi:dCMP deaminase
MKKRQAAWNKDHFTMADRGVLFKMYWDDLMNQPQIAKYFRVSISTVKRAMIRLDVPVRKQSDAVKLGQCGGRHLSSHKPPYWKVGRRGQCSFEHIFIMEKMLGRQLTKKEIVHHKDFCGLNNHPLNLEKTNKSEHYYLHPLKFPDRIPLYEVYMRMAEQIAMRSTCIRMKTGSVIVSGDLKKVYSLGFNGTVKGWVNSCNGIEGQCGCIHSEENALLKLGVEDSKKILFCTSGPCMNCAKKLIQSGFSDVFYRSDYRDKKPIVFLHYHGIRTCKYDLYKEHIWD